MSKQDFHRTIEALVEKFDRNIIDYKDHSSKFNETRLRIEFLDPMFEALGWDMNNKAGTAEQYREVIHEDKVYIEGKPKAPDYSFKFWGERKFFLEAKQPFVKIKTDYKPALQLRRYAWSAHLPISILSDFEEFAVYDTTIEPKASDKASVARLEYYKFNEYPDIWEKIYDTFAKESIQQGSFDKFIAKEKRGSQLVDKVFLKEIEDWREWLAKDLAKNNKSLSVVDLNYAVQKIIDRIIFLRIAEDRGIENYKNLENIVRSKNSYSELVKYFKRAHDKYNSGLFDFEADSITTELNVSDKLLDKILKNLYYPTSPYEFSVLGVELLGSIYEQFLGKVIRLTPSHNAKIEEKPEVKKAGGVYYTPQYIVEYIVKNTVGELLKGKTVKQAEKIKVLDPACGSGSFLIGAYEYLLDWHLEQYEKLSDKEKVKLEKKGVIYKHINKESTGKSIESWNLTTNEKKRIMLNNIYGVDIDSQAVEVTKLSLALKMLENENQESINKQMRLFAERILPDMGGNIKCGNSLVGSDYWDDKDLSEVSEEEIKKVNAFDWEVEFEEIMSKGGFDAVIGNPPYVRQEGLEFKDYFIKKYKEVSTGVADLYTYFFYIGITALASNGQLSFIVSNRFVNTNYGEKLRSFLLKNQITEIIDYNGFQVFDNANVDSLIITLKPKNKKQEIRILQPISREGISDFTSYKIQKINSSILKGSSSWNLKNPRLIGIENRIKKISTPLSNVSDLKINRGLTTGANSVFILNEEKYKELIKLNPNSKEIMKPVLHGRDLNRYIVKEKRDKRYIILTHTGIKINDYPEIYSYLKDNKHILDKVYETKKGLKKWYELRACSYYDKFNEKKLIWGRLSPLNKFAIDYSKNYSLDSTSISVGENLEYYLGLLNSKLIYVLFESRAVIWGKSGLKWFGKAFNDLPIIEFNKADHGIVIEMTELVHVQTIAHKSLENADSETKKQLIQKQIDATDEKINKLVYELYGLTQEEIDIVEGVG